MAQISEQVEWLNLIDRSGPFVVPAILQDAFPQGFEKVEAPSRQRLRAAYDEWRDAVDEGDPDIADLHAAWIGMVLREALEYDEVLAPRAELEEAIAYHAPEHGVCVVPDFVVRSGDGAPRLLIAVHPPDTDLEKPPPGDRWPSSPAERMTLLCRANSVRVGLVINGEQWMLVNAPIGNTSGYASWFARLWWQEPVTLRAFISLLGVRRYFGPADESLDQLLERSLAFQGEVTDTLGEQVRRAVEVLIQSLGRADEDRNGELLTDVSPTELYEAGLTIMMRLVFILCAEERGLLLLGDPIYDQHYAISTLRARLREDESQHGPEVLERRHDAWSRMLSVFRAVYGGVEHEALRMPALGGSLFDPDRFPFLEGRAKGTCWRENPAAPLPIDNHTVLLLLSALQVLEQRGGAQLVSYRALDIEQIGHVYEGLLEYTVARVPEVTIGLIGSYKVRHPIIGLRELEGLMAMGRSTVAERLAELTARPLAVLQAALTRDHGADSLLRLMQAVGGDDTLARRLEPFVGLIRTDSWGSLLVYRQGSFAIIRGATRRETGAHYTPRTLTEVIVERALESLVYSGPAEDKPPEEWVLKSPRELLDLKICDPAMGSGAFLVQACRYLSARLVETWSLAEAEGQAVAADGLDYPSLGDREPLPIALDDRLLIARRLVAERCLYGVDLNRLAVELAKLSLWLVTLAKGRPFGFLEPNLRCGDSLLGVSHLEELEDLALDDGTRPRRLRLFGRTIKSAVDEAVEIRKRLRAVPIRDIRDVDVMAHLNDDARRVLGRLLLLADVFIGHALHAGGNATALRARLNDLAIQADRLIGGDEDADEELCATRRALLAQGSAGDGRHRTPFHWPLEYPEVFVRDDSGFDVVIGNPPFLNAIENAATRDDQLRSYYRQAFAPFALGAYDLCLLFWARTLKHLLRRGGRYGLLSPTVLLSASAEWKAWMHTEWRPDFLALYPVDMFASARIRTTAICGGQGRARQVDVIDQDTSSSATIARRPWRDDNTNWFELVQFPADYTTVEASRRTVPLGTLVDLFAGCTTADAYNLKPLIEDSQHGVGPKLVTTGALDRYTLKWGEMPIRYLKDDYQYPRWPTNSSDRGVSRARDRQKGPKILVGGLTAVIEAWLDSDGDAAGIVQTWVIKTGHVDRASGGWLFLLLGILNSASFSRIFVNRHGAAAMSGKQITIKKQYLLEMPIPEITVCEALTPTTIADTLEKLPPEVWSEGHNADLVASALSAVAHLIQKLSCDSDEFVKLDKVAHHLAAALYGLPPLRREEDYRWWCERVRMRAVEESCESLIPLLRQFDRA